MATTTLRIKRLGVSVSAVLAVPYVVVLLASLLVPGVSTTGSWQAVFLGIGWRTIAGFEIGLLGAALSRSPPWWRAASSRARSST